MSSYINVKKSHLYVSYLDVKCSFPVKLRYLSGRNKHETPLTFSSEVNKNKSRFFRGKNVTNVNSRSWVFSNKCLPGELMIGGELCKPIRRDIPAGLVWWHTASTSCLNTASAAQHKQQTLLTSCVTTPESKPLAFITQRSKHIPCCLARNTETLRMQTQLGCLLEATHTSHLKLF